MRFIKCRKMFSWLVVIGIIALVYYGVLRSLNYFQKARLAHAVELKMHSVEMGRLHEKLQKTHKGDFLIKKSGEVCLITASIPGKDPFYMVRCSIDRVAIRLDLSVLDYTLLNTKDIALYGEPGYAEVAINFARQQ